MQALQKRFYALDGKASVMPELIMRYWWKNAYHTVQANKVGRFPTVIYIVHMEVVLCHLT